MAGLRAALAKRPLLSNMVMTSVLFATGDAVNQQLVEKKGLQKHDWISTGRMAAYGGLVFAPLVTPWYRILQTRINIPSSQTATIAARVAADQLVFAPFGIGLFFSCMAGMKGEGVKETLDAKWWNALKANWYLWPAVQAVNFSVVPLAGRVLVANVVSIGWNAYLAAAQGKSNVKEEGSQTIKLAKEAIQEKKHEIAHIAK